MPARQPLDKQAANLLNRIRMAERENIRNRIRRINAAALSAIDQSEERYRAAGGTAVGVDLTEDMSSEEQEMAILAGLLKGGCSPEEAEKETKKWLRLISRYE